MGGCGGVHSGAGLAGLEHNSRREKGEGQKRKSVL